MNLDGPNVMRAPKRTGEYITHELDPVFSRKKRPVKLPDGVMFLDACTVMALDAGGNAVPLAPESGDSTETAVGILYRAVEVDGSEELLTEHFTKVDLSALTWPADITDQQKADALAKLAENHVI